MSERRILTRVAVGLAVLAAVVPAGAIAGQRVVSGRQSLQIKATLTPAKAGARHVALRLQVDYQSTKKGQQPPYNSKVLVLLLPKGMVLDPTAAPACKRSALEKAKGNAAKACPATTMVGRGSLVANARPTIKQLIPATVTLYNAVDDVGKGDLKGARNLLLWAKTSSGITTLIAFRIKTALGGEPELVAVVTKPKKPGISPGSFSIQKVDITITGSGKKAYLTNPSRCTHSGWKFSLHIKNYFGQPGVRATDRAACTK